MFKSRSPNVVGIALVLVGFAFGGVAAYLWMAPDPKGNHEFQGELWNSSTPASRARDRREMARWLVIFGVPLVVLGLAAGVTREIDRNARPIDPARTPRQP